MPFAEDIETDALQSVGEGKNASGPENGEWEDDLACGDDKEGM